MADKLPDAYTETNPDLPKKTLEPQPTTKSGMQYYEDAKEWISKFYIRFTNSETAMIEKHKDWAEIDKFDRGEQWKDMPIPPWVPKPVTNLVRYVRTTKRANLASGISKPTFTPLHPDDVDTMHTLQLAHDHVWDTERVDRTVRLAIDRGELRGTSLAFVYSDDTYVGGKYFDDKDPKNELFMGEVKVKLWPIQNFFPDPDAYTLNTCKWIDTTEIVNLRDVKNNQTFIDYCEKNGTLDKLQALSYSQLDYDNDASGTIFERDYTPINSPRNVQGDEIITLHTHWERYFKGGKWHLDVTYWLRNTDFFLLRLEDVQPNVYPFAIYYDEWEDNDLWGTSTTKDILENQKISSKLQQTMAILGVLHQNPQKVVLRESGINAQELARTGTLPGKVWSSNVPGEQAITIVKPLPIPPELMQLDDRTQANIEKMMGMNEAYMGQAPGSVTTSTGVGDLLERATIRDRDKMVNIDTFVEQISHLILLHILYKWKDPRPLLQLAPNGKSSFKKYEPFDEQTIENLSWRVRSDIYAQAPLTQSSRRQQATQMLQYQGQYQYQPTLITPMEFIREMQLQDGEEIIERMEQEKKQIDAQKAQDYAQMIMQVAQQLEQAKKQGLADPQAQQMALQAAQQLLGQRQQEDNKNGTTDNQNQNQANPSTVGQGMSPQASQAMTSGV